MSMLLRIFLAALLAFSGASCKNERVFRVNGLVKEVQPERKQVKIEHENIPGYMAAMTMTFDVKDAQELRGIQPGDTILFRMVVSDKDGWIDQIKKTGTTTPVVKTVPEDFRRVREVDPLKEGDIM